MDIRRIPVLGTLLSIVSPPKPPVYQLDAREGALLVAMGFHPAKHAVQVVTHPVQGLRVVDRRSGRALKFFSRKRLEKPDMRKLWRAALRAGAPKAA